MTGMTDSWLHRVMLFVESITGVAEAVVGMACF